MKESKKIDNLNEDVDKETEKRFNKELNEIKEKLNAEKLSDEFKTNLQAKLQEELNKDNSNKGKIFNFPTISRKLAGICACFVFLFSSCFVFADDIENVILELFGNTDRIIAKAIEEGNYKDIEMDYVEDNGVSIKVDYVVIEDDELYVAFDVLNEEEFDKVFFEDFCIKNQNAQIIYDKKESTNHTKAISKDKFISNNNLVIIYELTISNEELKDSKSLIFEINNINCLLDNSSNIKDGNWNLEINI